MAMSTQILEDALAYHAREEQRLRELRRHDIWAGWFGPGRAYRAYSEAIYAHHAAQVHLRRLAAAAGVEHP